MFDGEADGEWNWFYGDIYYIPDTGWLLYLVRCHLTAFGVGHLQDYSPMCLKTGVCGTGDHWNRFDCQNANLNYIHLYDHITFHKSTNISYYMMVAVDEFHCIR